MSSLQEYLDLNKNRIKEKNKREFERTKERENEILKLKIKETVNNCVAGIKTKSSIILI